MAMKVSSAASGVSIATAKVCVYRPLSPLKPVWFLTICCTSALMPSSRSVCGSLRRSRCPRWKRCVALVDQHQRRVGHRLVEIPDDLGQRGDELRLADDLGDVTGADGLGDPKKTHSTIQGAFLIHTKHVAVTMDGDDVGDEERYASH